MARAGTRSCFVTGSIPLLRLVASKDGHGRQRLIGEIALNYYNAPRLVHVSTAPAYQESPFLTACRISRPVHLQLAYRTLYLLSARHRCSGLRKYRIAISSQTTRREFSDCGQHGISQGAQKHKHWEISAPIPACEHEYGIPSSQNTGIVSSRTP